MLLCSRCSSLTLEANTSISIGSPSPPNVVDSSFDTLVFTNANIAISGLFIEGDLVFDVFDFSGSLSLRGENIFVAGPFGGLDEVSLLVAGNGDSSSCSSGGSATVGLSLGLTSGLSTTLFCDNLEIGQSDLVNGGSFLIDIGGPPPVVAVPEPSGALLFPVGGLLASRSVVRSNC